MKTYPYLRAYMAGITIPTMMLIFILIVFTIVRYVYDASLPIEKIIVFPMAIAPNLWGLWNVLYVYLRRFREHSIGLHGAVLALVQVTIAYLIVRMAGFELPGLAASVFPFGLPVVVIVFYLVWKHLVNFFNGVLGID